MTRTLLVTVLLALLAAPVALAQPHGPPPGYTDPNEYARDYAAQQAAAAQQDPVGYAQSRDPAAEAGHAAWLACWEAYEAAGHALDAACSAFFTAPVTVDPAVEGATGEVTEVLEDTGAPALADETLDAVQDTVDDPTTAVEQVGRIVGAAIKFVKDLIDFAKDALTMLGLGVAAGLIGAVEGLVDLGSMPVDGLGIAGRGLAAVGSLVASALGLVGGATLSASSMAGHGLADAALAVVHGVAAAASATAHGIGAVLGAIGSTVAAAGRGVADGAQAAGHGVADAAHAVQEGVAKVADKVAGLFEGKPERSSSVRDDLPKAPKTGTEADGLLDRLLGKL